MIFLYIQAVHAVTESVISYIVFFMLLLFLSYVGCFVADFHSLSEKGFHHVIPHDVYTNISVKNLSGSEQYDNIWLASWTHRTMYTGQWGVVRDGLTHQLIPHGWSWGGTVSDHVPIFAEFYHDRDLDTSATESVTGIAIDVS